MRILCCLDGTNLEQIRQAVEGLVNRDEAVIGLLYVIDSAGRDELDRKRERLLRARHPIAPLQDRMARAEAEASEEIVQEGQRVFPQAEALQREGRPEREIVQQASEWQADLVIVSPRSPDHGGPVLGPKSVGHVARFVLDHAPCPVLLVRPRVDGPLNLPPPPPRPH